MRFQHCLTVAALCVVTRANACSLIEPQAFTVRANGRQVTRAPPKPALELVSLIGGLAGRSPDDSCAGVGWIRLRVQFARGSRADLRHIGYLIRPVSGVHEVGMFPKAPIEPIEIGREAADLFWGWYGVTPDADGHLRWVLEVVGVSRSGQESEPATICVSTDQSCDAKSAKTGERASSGIVPAVRESGNFHAE